MFEIDKYIGRVVCKREISIVIGNNDDELLLFCSYDIVEQEMQDYAALKDEEYVEFLDEGGKFKLRYEVKKVEFSNSLISTLGKDTEARLIPLHQERDVDILKPLLPQRNTASFVRVFQNEKKKQAIGIIADGGAIVEKIKEFSIERLGFDITSVVEYVGDTVVICYNPIFKSIDFREDGRKGGLYFRVNYWNGCREQLVVNISGKERDGAIIWNKSFKTIEGMFLSHFDFTNCPLLDIEVRSLDGEIVDFYKDVAFIHSISVNIGMKG